MSSVARPATGALLTGDDVQLPDEATLQRKRPETSDLAGQDVNNNRYKSFLLY
jgi:hypothetical protein